MNEQRLEELKKAGIVQYHPMTATYRGRDVSIGPEVQIGKGTVIWPNVFLLGNTVIGENCEVESGTRLEDSVVGDGSIIHANCYLSSSKVGKECELWIDISLYHTILEDRVTMNRSSRLVWTRVGRNSHLEQGCQIKYADIGENCRICNSIIEGEKLSEEQLLAGKRTVYIRYSCVIGPWIVIQGPAEIGPRAEILLQAKIIRSDIGYSTKVDGARVQDSTVSYNCVIGEGAYIHDNSRIESGCHIARCEIAAAHILHGRHIHPIQW